MGEALHHLICVRSTSSPQEGWSQIPPWLPTCQSPGTGPPTHKWGGGGRCVLISFSFIAGWQVMFKDDKSSYTGKSFWK